MAPETPLPGRTASGDRNRSGGGDPDAHRGRLGSPLTVALRSSPGQAAPVEGVGDVPPELLELLEESDEPDEDPDDGAGVEVVESEDAAAGTVLEDPERLSVR